MDKEFESDADILDLEDKGKLDFHNFL